MYALEASMAAMPTALERKPMRVPSWLRSPEDA
jgi:hypothetical protein